MIDSGPVQRLAVVVSNQEDDYLEGKSFFITSSDNSQWLWEAAITPLPPNIFMVHP